MTLPGRTTWRQAARMLVATAIAYFGTRAVHLHSGYWAMITTVLVVQGNLGGTLAAGFWRLVSTIIGGLLGMLGVLARAHQLAPDWVILGVVLAPLALISAADARLRPSPVTALIVLLVAPAAGSGIDLALGRIGEIAIGSVIGIAVAALVLPRRAEAALREQAATALQVLGALAEAYLGGATPPAAQRGRLRAALAAAETTHDELKREQAVHLGGGLAADPLLAGLRALRVDVFMLRRVAAERPDLLAGRAFAAPVGQRFAALAAALAGTSVPASASVPDLAAVPEPLQFCLHVLDRDLADLERRVMPDAAPGTPQVETAAH